MSRESRIELTQEKARMFTLKRQFLTKPAKKPLDAVRAIIAIQAQYAASVPIAIWARCENLKSSWVDDAFSKTHELVKIWCMRSTIHAIASSDLAMLAQSIGHEYSCEHLVRLKKCEGLDQKDVQRQNNMIMSALANGPLYRSELHAKVPELGKIRGASWGVDVKRLIFTGDVVINELSGRETRFARRDIWLAEIPWKPQSKEIAMHQLLFRYLSSYGPATIQDFAHWSGLRMQTIRSLFESCASELIPIEVSDLPGTYYLLKKDEFLAKSIDDDLHETVILPKFDALMMSHRDKSRFLDPSDYKKVFLPVAQVEALVLLRGKVAATWRSKSQGSKIIMNIKPFRKLNRDELSNLHKACSSLSDFLGFRDFSHDINQ